MNNFGIVFLFLAIIFLFLALMHFVNRPAIKYRSIFNDRFDRILSVTLFGAISVVCLIASFKWGWSIVN